MDKANGHHLQSFQGHINTNYRIRSTLAFADSTVISGSEDGRIYAWDVLSGDVLERLEADADADAHGGKVASAVASSSAKREWASAGIDGEFEIYIFFGGWFWFWFACWWVMFYE